MTFGSTSLWTTSPLPDELVGKFQTLATQPGIGRTRDELAERVRSFPVGNHVIFYRAIQDGIEVARVLSGFRDIPNLFTGD